MTPKSAQGPQTQTVRLNDSNISGPGVHQLIAKATRLAKLHGIKSRLPSYFVKDKSNCHPKFELRTKPYPLSRLALALPSCAISVATWVAIAFSVLLLWVLGCCSFRLKKESHAAKTWPAEMARATGAFTQDRKVGVDGEASGSKKIGRRLKAQKQIAVVH